MSSNVTAARGVLEDLLDRLGPKATTDNPAILAIREAVRLLILDEHATASGLALDVTLRKCDGPDCRTDIAWGTTLDRKRVPLDPRPSVYLPLGIVDGRLSIAQIRGALTNHFSTCKNPEVFSRRAKV